MRETIDIAVDLGGGETRIFIQGLDTVIEEPMVVAIGEKNEPLAFGRKALELDRCGVTTRVIRPFAYKLIADFELFEALLGHFIQNAISKLPRRERRELPRALFAIPHEITKVELEAISQCARMAGVGENLFIDRSMAVMTGWNTLLTKIPVAMLIDMDYDNTEITIVSAAGIAGFKDIRIGRINPAEAVIQHLRKSRQLNIGEKTAVDIVSKCDNMDNDEENAESMLEVKGRGALSGLPESVNVTLKEMRPIILEPINDIIDACRGVISGCPPELTKGLEQNGVVLAGGGTRQQIMKQAIAKELELPVRIPDAPERAVIHGLGIFSHGLENNKEDSAESMDEGHYNPDCVEELGDERLEREAWEKFGDDPAFIMVAPGKTLIVTDNY